MQFDERLAAARRLAVLRYLQERAEYTAHEHDVGEHLATQGLAASLAQLRADLAWLDEQGLIVAQQPGGVWLATLTQRGHDVARGRATVPGVRRPAPGE